jgi:hypothetical protein
MLSQIKGEPPRVYNPDTVYIFNSPRPLFSNKPPELIYDKGLGVDLLFSGNGFGAGTFFQRTLAVDWYLFASLYISGARNTDEFDTYDPYTGQLNVVGKVNRLFMFPLMFGVQHNIFTNVLSESFKPYLSAGLGPTYILSTPYDREFFNSFGYSRSYIRFGSFVGFGANFGSSEKSLTSFNVRYYYIPFGGNGLESMSNNPIKDFGGLFLSLSVGIRY